jgi:hypothetical protein
MAALLDEVRALRERGFDDIADRVVRSTDTTLMLEKTWLNKAIEKKSGRPRKFLRRVAIAAGLGSMALGAWYFTHGAATRTASSDGPDPSEFAQISVPSPVASTVSASGTRTVESAHATLVAPELPTPPPRITGDSPTAPNASSSTSKVSTLVKKAKENKQLSVSPGPKKTTVAKRTPAPRPKASEKSVKQRETEFLSARARQRLQQGKLDRPFGDNAVYYRDELVRVAPGSAVAARISYDIAERYRLRAEKEIAAGQFLAARESIDDGLRVRPDHKRLKRLKENAVSEYSKGWAKGMFDQFKKSLNNAEPGPVRSSSAGPDK